MNISRREGQLCQVSEGLKTRTNIAWETRL